VAELLGTWELHSCCGLPLLLVGKGLGWRLVLLLRARCLRRRRRMRRAVMTMRVRRAVALPMAMPAMAPFGRGLSC
jgi:hypothetical protein